MPTGVLPHTHPCLAFSGRVRNDKYENRKMTPKTVVLTINNYLLIVQ